MSSNYGILRFFYRTACGLALVSVVFCLVVGALMASNLMLRRTASPLNVPELDQLRAEVIKSPDNEALKNRIQDLDLAVRRFYFASIVSMRTGSFLLLGGLVFVFGALKIVSVIRRRLPNPKEYPADADPKGSIAMARWVVGGFAVALMAGAFAGSFLVRESRRPAVAMTGGSGAGKAPVTGVVDQVAEWPGFRGLSGSGISAYTNLPVAWDVVSGQGVLWKVKVPLPGMSSPVVAGNRVIVTGATDKQREIYCYDIANGTLLWRSGLAAIPDAQSKIPEVDKATGFAAPTPVTDGRNVYAVFANGDIGSIDLCAQKNWAKNLGVPANMYGHAASLALYKNKVIVQFDQKSDEGGTSQLTALDVDTGRPLWETDRPVDDSWPSPIVAQTGNGPQIITSAAGWIIAYNPDSGQELWKVKCEGADVTPSPIYAGGLVLVSVSGDKVYAIRPDGRGDVSATHVAWTFDEVVGDVASPVSNGELVFLAHTDGVIACLEVATGKKIWLKEVDESFYASPAIAGDRCYLVARDGQVYIFKVGRQYEEIGRPKLGENSDCSPAFVDGRIIFRGAEHLFCIGSK